MRRELVFTAFLVIFNCVMALALVTEKPKAATNIVYIRADGSIDPPTAFISTEDNITYILTDNIFGHVVVEKNDTIVDGGGHVIHGAGIGGWIGVFISGRNNVTIRKMTVKTFDVGIYLGSTSNSTIQENNVTDNEYGFELEASTKNRIAKNNITENDFGFRLEDNSNCNIVSRNNITNNYDNIWVLHCRGNKIHANGITATNGFAIAFYYSYDNTIYHNNIQCNGQQLYIENSTNTWNLDYPSGGNYWSHYNGTDTFSGPFQNETGSDGIGDSNYTIDTYNTDRYPLMGKLYDVTVIAEDGRESHVQLISNSSINSLQLLQWPDSPNEYLQPGQDYIRILLSGADNSSGFCRITIPRTVLNDTYIVLVDWHPVPATQLAVSNSTHAYLYFTYQHSEHEVMVVSENLPLTVLAALMIAALTMTKKAGKRREIGNG